MADGALTLLGAAAAAYDVPESVHETGCCMLSSVTDLQRSLFDGALTWTHPMAGTFIIGELVHGW